MADGVRASGVDELNKIGHLLKEASDKTLTNNVRKALREVGKPLGERVIQVGSAEMPDRNGFSARVRSLGKVGLSTALTTKTTRVTLLLRNKGVQMKALDAGILRHPVFGNRSNWVRQNVPAGAFSRAFEKEARVAQEAALHAANKTLSDIAHKV